MQEQLSIDFEAAREAGSEAAARCAAKAVRVASFDTEGARQFILGWLRTHGATPGEVLTNAAKENGFRPHDDRAFGAVYGALSRQNLIRCVGSCDRVKGHGTAGGRVWAVVR
jgi:hypothetical protein